MRENIANDWILRSAAAVKVRTAGSLLSSKLFGFFVFIYFFIFSRHAGV